MGAAMAIAGFKGAMSILHGSQGCATYIRRHMATHFNEPIDIASSALSEEGAVFGGEKNLQKGLDNLIKMYHPQVIGVCSTCLAETIGEDLKAMIKRFHEKNPGSGASIIDVSSPGYGGTQNEGFFRALRAIVEQTVSGAPHKAREGGLINIVAPMISPADTRWLKSFLNEAGVRSILIPDISDNLDGVAQKRYERLKSGGTPLSDVMRMKSAEITLEFSEFISEKDSPGAFLRDAFGVPLLRLPLPTGLRGMDRFIDILCAYGGKISAEHAKERGRYLDAMADSHKANAKARAAVFGDPDFVKGIVSLCCENGAVPVLAATGSACAGFKRALGGEIEKCAQNAFAEGFEIADDCDFSTIEHFCGKLGANIMIGSSDGRRAAGRLGIDLIRRGFPIHDHVGGQRTRTLGFDGSLGMLDEISNSMLSRTEENFRRVIYNEHFKPLKEISKKERLESHPCFSGCASQNARIHLPVAPKCNIQCGYCKRSFDCPNESRPGAASKVLSPNEALERYKRFKKNCKNLTVAGIAGPGDALANFDDTRETIRLIKGCDPQVMLCLSTNGLMLPIYAAELIKLGVGHMTVTVNTVDPSVGAKIISYADFLGRRFTGEAAAGLLIANQLSGIKMASEMGAVIKVNCVALKGINDGCIEEVSKKASELGAYMVNIMPHIPIKGSQLECLEKMSVGELEALRTTCEPFARQMRHCRQCSADAAGTLDMDFFSASEERSAHQEFDTENTKRFAVASKSGIIVDQHFGHAEEFLIFDSDGASSRFVERRKISRYCGGAECDEEGKWAKILKALSDCDGVLAVRIGHAPEEKLRASGIVPIRACERIEGAVAAAAGSLREAESASAL
jgi:nitrogenase molybdenum-iron protein alpha/beta subunit/MoaA/NifB/PqqE/SkfB family radical SAM enzyme